MSRSVPLLFSPTSTLSLMSRNTRNLNVTKCPPNAAFKVRINCCIYPKLHVKRTLTFTLSLLLKCIDTNVGCKCLDTSCWMPKSGVHLIRVNPGHKWVTDLATTVTWYIAGNHNLVSTAAVIVLQS